MAGAAVPADRAGSAFDAVDPPDTETYLDCIHCGFCLPTCPTYMTLANEMDSPRGRIYLIRAAAEGRIGIGDSFVRHMNLCLVCRACETVCPAGVKFGHLMEAARGQIRRHYRYPAAERRLRDFILNTFADPARLAWLVRVLWLYQRSGLQTLVRASGVLGLLGRLGEMERLLPPVPGPRGRAALPGVTPASGRRRGRAGLLTGCVQGALFPEVNRATARVLAENGHDVVVPPEQGCCGSLLVHEGERERGKALARAMIDCFERSAVEVVAVAAAGCGSVMKEYGALLHDDPVYAAKAEAFGRRVKDVSEVLAASPIDGGLGRLPITVTYHEPCHLAHAQRVRAEPRAVIRAIPDVRLLELRESDVCCGSAGIYNLINPEESRRLLDRKLDCIAETGADYVASGNPGCLAQLRAGIRRRGMRVRAVHPVELLAWAYHVGAGRDPRSPAASGISSAGAR
jgi:glycolate oxidase iron-sulfur subunit